MNDATTPALEQQLALLRRRMHRLEALFGIVVLAGLVLGATPRAPEVLRARGLVLEDGAGHARLLLGVPVPDVAERKRHDEADGLVLLDEQGNDRLQLGHVGGPQMGGVVQPRISPATGLAVCDARGDERGGFGVMENGRVALGLDAPSGEGVMPYVAPDLDQNGLMINTHVGDQTIQRISLGAGSGEATLLLNDPAGTQRVALHADTAAAKLDVFDAEGHRLLDAFDGQR